MTIIKLTILLLLVSCSTTSVIQLSSGLKVQEIAPSTYVATDTDFYSSNILITKTNNQTVFIISSPFDVQGSQVLLNWIESTLAPNKIIAINTHFHRDGIAGNYTFLREGVEVWASEVTDALTRIEMSKGPESTLSFIKDSKLKERVQRTQLARANNTFKNRTGKRFVFDDEEIEVYFPGHAHSPDNVVVYLKNKKILFGGCMIKPGTSLGYLEVADIPKWRVSLQNLYRFDISIVIPGHGPWGGEELLSRTLTNLNNYKD